MMCSNNTRHHASPPGELIPTPVCFCPSEPQAIYALLAIFTVTFPNNSESAVMTSSIITAVRFAAAIFLVDFNVMIPAQTMSLVEV